jgi:hypothetical protein
MTALRRGRAAATCSAPRVGHTCQRFLDCADRTVDSWQVPGVHATRVDLLRQFGQEVNPVICPLKFSRNLQFKDLSYVRLEGFETPTF